MKRLIINADDFGLTSGVNRAIAEAHQSGLVTSATLMANGAQFSEAVALARGMPQLGVGCHIDLIQFAPLSPPEKLKTLVRDGHFRPGFRRFATAALRRRLSSDEIAAEASAQIARLQSAGIHVTHFDTHKHTHLFPGVLRPLLQAAKACGIRAVRNPFEPHPLVRLRSVASAPKLLTRYVAVRTLRAMAAEFRRLVEAEGFATTDGTVGIVLTGFWNEKRLADLLRRLPDGTWELVTHPGYHEPALASLGSLVASREAELRLLTSPETRRLLEQHEIELISYRDLSS
ncbi:MAG: carbohydrate deacetylase [Terriglobales bacterium]